MAWEIYEKAHQADLNREYYVLHTDREELNIGIIDAFGRVVLNYMVFPSMAF